MHLRYVARNSLLQTKYAIPTHALPFWQGPSAKPGLLAVRNPDRHLHRIHFALSSSIFSYHKRVILRRLAVSIITVLSATNLPRMHAAEASLQAPHAATRRCVPFRCSRQPQRRAANVQTCAQSTNYTGTDSSKRTLLLSLAAIAATANPASPAHAGAPIHAGEIAGTTINGHDNFQNAQAFIDGEGSRGLQEQVLLSELLLLYLSPLL